MNQSYQEQVEQPEVTEGKKKKVRRKHSRLVRNVRRVLALLVTAALAVAAVFVVNHSDELNASSLRQWISDHSASASANQQAESYSFHGDVDSSIAVVDRNLLVCSSTELQVYQRNGDTALTRSVNMQKPVIQASGKYAVVYDAGGTELYLIYRSGIQQTLTTKEGQEILSASVNDNGYITVVQKATGYKASTTVYDRSLKALVTENISSSFTTNAVLSPDNKTLALVSVGEDASGFDSVIVFYNVSDGQEKGRCTLGSDVVLDMNWNNSGLWCIGGYGTYMIQNCALTTSYVDSTQYLKNFSLGGSGYAALLFNKYQGSSTGSLTVLNAAGTELSVGINEEVLSVSAAGEYIGVLTANALTIYLADDLSVYAETENSIGAHRVIMQSDGSALIVSTTAANYIAAQ